MYGVGISPVTAHSFKLAEKNSITIEKVYGDSGHPCLSNLLLLKKPKEAWKYMGRAGTLVWSQKIEKMTHEIYSPSFKNLDNKDRIEGHHVVTRNAPCFTKFMRTIEYSGPIETTSQNFKCGFPCRKMPPCTWELQKDMAFEISSSGTYLLMILVWVIFEQGSSQKKVLALVKNVCLSCSFQW